MDLYVVENSDYGFRLIIRATSWQEAKEKAVSWFFENHNRKTDASQWDAVVCDNDEIIE